jgi:hypothetical protein
MIYSFDNNWYPFAGFEHDHCELCGPCHDLFILQLDWNSYLYVIEFPWLEV